MSVVHFDQSELAARWRISPRTLEQWRWRGKGPQFLKLGGRVVYRLSDIEEFEQALIQTSTQTSVQIVSQDVPLRNVGSCPAHKFIKKSKYTAWQ